MKTFRDDVLRALYLFSPALIFLVIYWVILVKLSMGQDMLIMALEEPGPLIWTVVAICISSVFFWLGTRLLEDTYTKKWDPVYKKLFIHTPRLIGYFVFVIIIIGVVSLPRNLGLGLPENLHWVITASIIAGSSFAFISLIAVKPEKLHGWFRIFWISSLVYLILLIVIVTVSSEYDRHIENSRWFLGFLILGKFTFLIGTKIRGTNRSRPGAKQSIDEKTIIWPLFPANYPFWKAIYWLLALGALLIFLIATFSDFISYHMSGLATVLLGLCLWLALFCLLKKRQLRSGVRFGFVIILLAVIFGLYINPYQLRTEDLDGGEVNQFGKRLDLKSAVHAWLNDSIRHQEIVAANDSNPYKVYLIMSDGGASKSGYWSASCLAYFDSVCGGSFTDHILCLSGASGGSVGNGAFYAGLIGRDSATYGNLRGQIDTFFNHDYLVSSITRFVGFDILRHLSPVKIPFLQTRAGKLEEVMEEGVENSISRGFSSRADTTMRFRSRYPILFVNSTSANDGQPAVLSNVKIDTSFSNRLDFFTYFNEESDRQKTTISFSTALLVGARFPYISPAANIGRRDFVDGGYFDNSGGGITHELLQLVLTDLSFDTIKDRLEFHLIHFTNGDSANAELSAMNPLTNDVAAPLVSVLGTYVSQTSFGDKRLDNLAKLAKGKSGRPLIKIHTEINLPQRASDKEPYPMNWVISDYNLKRMRDNIQWITYRPN